MARADILHASSGIGNVGTLSSFKSRPLLEPQRNKCNRAMQAPKGVP